MPIIQNNIFQGLIFRRQIDFRTRIYSDGFSSYQPEDFLEMDYVLHKVYHSILYGQGIIHINTVESFWSQIKYLSKDFSGINFNLLDNLVSKGISARDLLNDLICYYLFLRIYQIIHLI